MNKELYHIYCKDILAVKTNICDFKWIYGSVAPNAHSAEYEKCIVKFDIQLTEEFKLENKFTPDKQFQSYFWNQDTKTIHYRRTLFSVFNIGYNISIQDNRVFVQIGKNYYKYIKNRTMNLHGMYYLLADIANVLLLKNGLLTLYASAAYDDVHKKGLVNFAPPNTGKSLTVLKLCEKFKYKVIGEDIVITDGLKLYSCPWTSSYRKKKNKLDSAGSVNRSNRNLSVQHIDECVVTDLFVLSLGNEKINKDSEDVINSINILNGYLFNYYSSPIVKILAYFDLNFRLEWQEIATNLIKKLMGSCNNAIVQTSDPVNFYEIINLFCIGSQI